jgi:hypothetical protein
MGGHDFQSCRAVFYLSLRRRQPLFTHPSKTAKGGAAARPVAPVREHSRMAALFGTAEAVPFQDSDFGGEEKVPTLTSHRALRLGWGTRPIGLRSG